MCDHSVFSDIVNDVVVGIGVGLCVTRPLVLVSDIELSMFKLYQLIFNPIMFKEPSLEQNIITHYTYLICAQYLRILFSSFGEENFQRFALNLLLSKGIWLLFCQ